MLAEHLPGRLEILLAYDGLVVIFCKVDVFLALVVMAIELDIGVGLLEEDVTGVFVICEDSFTRGRDPFGAALGGNILFVQHRGDGAGRWSLGGRQRRFSLPPRVAQCLPASFRRSSSSRRAGS